jgi:Flp pilus assembly protein TadB
MFGLSADTWGALGAIAGLVGTAAAAITNRIAASDKRAHDLEMKQVNESIERLDTSMKKAWEYVDDLRINAVRRQDQDRLREEFRADIKAMGDRLVAELTALRNDIHRDQSKGGA